MEQLKAPFPYHGGKSRIASEIWKRFGDPDIYIEPFAGSLAVLLARPSVSRHETVNDSNCFVTNFWRAVKAKPIQVLNEALHPLNEIEMKARHTALQDQADDLRTKLIMNTDWFDARLAGWWVYGICCSFGEAWMKNRYNQKPSREALGLIRRDKQTGLAWLEYLKDRLQKVRICSGDWQRVLTPIEIGLKDRKPKTAAILLDPPYANVSVNYGNKDKSLSTRVREWAIEHESIQTLRIALCGYEGEHLMPKGWECLAWQSTGSLSKNPANRKRERIWFSPACC